MRLNLDNNLISEWTASPEHPTSSLVSLTSVSLADNQLAHAPEALGELESLKVGILFYGTCLLDDFPKRD